MSDFTIIKLNLSLLEQTSGDYSKGLLLYEERDKKRCLLLHENFKEEHLTELKDLKTINTLGIFVFV